MRTTEVLAECGPDGCTPAQMANPLTTVGNYTTQEGQL